MWAVINVDGHGLLTEVETEEEAFEVVKNHLELDKELYGFPEEDVEEFFEELKNNKYDTAYGVAYEGGGYAIEERK